VYHITVSALVPAVRLVAVSKLGVPTTRCGGSAKKSLEAAIAEAAVSEVSASLPTAVVRALRRFEAVIVLFPPMVNSFGPGLVEVVAVSVMLSLEPSGSVK
jgi:hypothetical protein